MTDLTGKRVGARNRVAEFGSKFVRKGELVVNVRDYGAVGDGITDDTEAIKAAVAAIPNDNGNRGGATLFFDFGRYLINETIEINAPGTHATSASTFGAQLMPGPNLTGPVMRMRHENGLIFRGPSVSNIVFRMRGSTNDALVLERAYDNVILENVFISSLGGNSNGISIIRPDKDGPVSQTITAINCWVSGARPGEGPLFTGRAWNLEGVQEAVFISCKGFGGSETSGTAWYIAGSRGIQLYGCSAAGANVGFHLDSTVRTQVGITIDGPTLEGLSTTLICETDAAFLTSNLVIRNPRIQLFDTMTAGAINLAHVTGSTLETSSLAVNIASSCDQVRIISADSSGVVNNGTRSVVWTWANANGGNTLSPSLNVASPATPYYRLSVPGRSGAWEQRWSASGTGDYGWEHVFRDATGTIRRVHTVNANGSAHNFMVRVEDGTFPDALRVAPPASDQTAAMLLVNVGGTLSLRRVRVGPPDSGGTGQRALTVDN